jgi:Immunoglobulin domain
MNRLRLPYLTPILFCVALLLPQRARAQAAPDYYVDKIAEYTQTSSSTPVANPANPFLFVAGAPNAGTFLGPPPDINQRVLDFSASTEGFAFTQNFSTAALLDQSFPSGNYVFSSSGMTTATINIGSDLYPPIPQVQNGTWNSAGQLLLDPTTNYVLNFNTFTGYANAGVDGFLELLIAGTTAASPNAFMFTSISTTTAQAPTGATIPAGTLTPGTSYTGTLVFETDTLNDNTTLPGSNLSASFVGVTTFMILPQASAGGGGTSALVATTEPTSQTVASGHTVTFTFVATGAPSPTYQWFFNGAPVASGTGSTLVISGATSANAGSYTCTATNSSGPVTSRAASLAVVSTQTPGHLVNLSTRAMVGTGGNILIAGFAVGGGAGNEPLLARASGPALAAFNVTGTLPDPQLQLYNGSTVLATNNGWAGDPTIAADAAAVGAFAWTSPTSHDSALATSLGAGAYTAQVSGQSKDTGIALAEIYDATPTGAYTPASPRLVNLSARVTVGTGGNILIAGFVIGGSTSETVLIRASGPALVGFGVAGALPDPALKLYSGTTVLAANNAWGGNAQIASAAAGVGAFAWSSASSNDSAILISLPPGAYTAEVAGATGDTGISLVEVYEVP